MSRTYRKIRVPQSNVGYRRWRHYFGANDVALLRNPPEPYLVPANLRETITETYQTYVSDWDDTNRIFVSKGVPGAKMTADWVWDEKTKTAIPHNERWYILRPSVTKTHTYTKYVGPNPEWDKLRWREWSDYQHIFKHVRKQGASHRHPGPCRRDKYVETRRKRNEQKRFTVRELQMYYEELSTDERDCSS